MTLGAIGSVPVETLLAQYRGWFLRFGVFAVTVGVIYLAGRLLVVPPVVRAIDRRNPDNQTIVDAVGLYLRVVFLVVALPVAVAAAGFGGVVAGSTVVVAAATLAVGVAGQDIIGNFVSRVFLVANPDFSIGDYIEWADRAGTVQQIDLRVTRMRTPDGDTVVVPNSNITTAAVRRPYASGQYRLTEQVTVGYGESVERVATLLVEAAEGDDRVATEPAPVANVSELGGSAVEFTVWLWVDDPRSKNLADVRTEFAARAAESLLDAGVDLAPADPRELSGSVEVTATPRE
jgi:small conductance mechanosensitive channel